MSKPEFGHPVNNGYPALARGADGDLWLAWTSRREADFRKKGSASDLIRADHVILKRRNAGGWSREIQVSTDHTLNCDPTVVASGDGAWVIWTRRNKEFELLARHIGKELELSSTVSLVKSAAAARAASAPDGTVWLVWESFQNGHNAVHSMFLKNGAWTEPVLVSHGPFSAYRPSLAISASGVVSIVWDGGGDDRYGVFLRQWKAGRWDEVRRVPSPEGLDAYAGKVAAAEGARVWIAYAYNTEKSAEWGLRGVRLTPIPRPSVRAILWTGDRWLIASGPNPQDPGFIANNADMPDIAATDKGGVEVVVLRLKSHLNFRLWASSLSASGWTEPRQLDDGEEEYSNILFPGAPKARVDQRPSLAASGDRIVMAYERGTGLAQNRQIAVREFPTASDPPRDAQLLTATAPAAQPREQYRRAEQSGEYQVYFGDIHTHLLMDDGHVGTADQFHTFARDRRKLDFGAYTPHAESNKLIGSEIAQVQRIAAAFNQPGRYVGISGWEWTQGDFKYPQEGHKHIISETDDQPFFSSTEADSDSAKELTERMRGTTGIMFAHHVSRASSGATNFDAVDPAVEPNLEIASHWGRFEYFGNPGYTKDEVRGASVQDAWQKGLRVGVVGGSDNHDLFTERGTALTGVIAKNLDRHSLFEALRDRHCYATTGEKILLDVRVNGHPMGSAIRSKTAPVVSVKVTGTDVLDKVEVVKFWKGAPYPFPAVYSIAPGSPTAAFEWKDLRFTVSASYYVRVTQRADPRISGKSAFGSATAFPSEMAWSSPIWVDR